jgi:hypothetical protein
MKFIFKSVLLTALLSVILPAQAAIQSYNFNGAMDSGFYNGSAFSGSFSFDDASLTSTGFELLNLNSVDMSFLNTNYTLANSLVAPDISFQDGSFLGLSWSVNSLIPDVGFTFVAGSVNANDAFIAYDTTLGTSGAGNVIYAAVPEPETYAMLLIGLGLMGVVARRRNVV